MLAKDPVVAQWTLVLAGFLPTLVNALTDAKLEVSMQVEVEVLCHWVFAQLPSLLDE